MKALRQWCSGTLIRDTNHRVRCPVCRKVLAPYAVFCVGGELVGFRTPPHKTKPKTFKRPKGDRRSRRVG